MKYRIKSPLRWAMGQAVAKRTLERRNRWLETRNLSLEVSILLTNQLEHRRVDRAIESFTGVELGDRSFALVLFALDGDGEWSEKDRERAINLTASGLDRATALVWCPLEPYYCALLGVERGQSAQALAQGLERALEGEGGISASLSGMRTDLEEMWWLYQEAMAAHDHGVGDGRPVHLYTANSHMKSMGNQQQLSRLEMRLLDLVRNRSFYEAAKVFDQLLQWMVNDSLMTIHRAADSAHQRMLQVLGCLGLSITTVSQPEQYSSALRGLYKVSSFDGLANCCHDFFAMLEDSLSSGSYSYKAGQIRAYVEAHYPEPSLGAQQICDEFLFSQSYLSRIFKNEIGKKVSDYIHEVRVRETKALLQGSQMPISEICTKVGYTNRSTMHRAFRELTGMSPSEYRRLYRGRNSDKINPAKGAGLEGDWF